MTDREPIETTNLDRYGDADLPWSRARQALEATGDANDTWFLGTATKAGRPHAAGIGALWHEGQLFFTSGPGTRKAKDLEANPAATISVRLQGIDLVFEGVARRVIDVPTLEAPASHYRNDGWPVKVDGDAFTAPYSAPSAGPPPWLLFRLDFDRVYGVATAEPNGATRWRFAP